MSTLGIFTVKRIARSDGSLWTYGGFGRMVHCLLPYFEKIILVAHQDPLPPGPGHYRIDDPRLELVALPPTPSELHVIGALPAMLRTAREVMPRLDVVQARLPDYTGIIGARVARAFGVPCFHVVVADWAAQAKQTSWRKRGGLGTLLKLHLELYDRIERATCSGALVFAQGAACHAKHATLSDAHLVSSSAHTQEDVAPLRPRFRQTPYRILSVGRLDSIKNHPLLLRALALMVACGEPFEAVIVGDGPRRADLEREIAELGLTGRVRLVGMVEHGPELWRHYDDADVLALTSLAEGTPKVLYEAMARGLPVVASAVGGVPTIVAHERNGLLFSSDDVASLVTTLRRCASDAGLRARLVQAAQATAREHTVEEETRRMVDVVFSRWPELAPTAQPREELRVGVAS